MSAREREGVGLSHVGPHDQPFSPVTRRGFFSVGLIVACHLCALSHVAPRDLRAALYVAPCDLGPSTQGPSRLRAGDWLVVGAYIAAAGWRMLMAPVEAENAHAGGLLGGLGGLLEKLQQSGHGEDVLLRLILRRRLHRQGDRGIIMSALLTAVSFLTSITTKECGLGIANESQAEA